MRSNLAKTQYHTRFYVNPNSLALGSGEAVDLFTGRNASTDVVRIQLRKNGATYQIRAGLLKDAGTWTDTSWYNINNSWNAVEIQYQVSPRRHGDAFANSGSLTLWLDDAQKQSLTFIDNDTRPLTEVRLGAQSIETGTRGTLYFDDFESRRFSYIGTLTDPGVDDPTATNQAGWFGRTYQYSATIPHAVTSVNPETGSPDTYSYDANGNMTCRVEGGVTYSQAYNAENRISSIAKRTGDCATGTILESWSFAYDGDGTRVMTAHFTGTSGTPDSTTSYYMGGQFEVKDGTTKKYYSIAGMMVAVNDGTGLQYLLTDHLGSTVAVTNQTGTLTSQQRYLPFGAPRTIPNSPILGTDFTYTGQRMLDEDMGGIMDYRARFYSPSLMRFLQPDSIIPDQTNPQSWNRFMYVGNNPINNNDPDGHCYPVCTALLGAVIGGVVGASIYAATNQGDSFSWGELAVAAGAGALAGGLIGTGVGLLAAGAATTATAATASSLIGAGVSATITGTSYMAGNKNKFETKPFVIQTGTAAVAGAITSNPGSSLSAKMLANAVAAEAAYFTTGEQHSLKGAAITATIAVFATAFQFAGDVWAEESLMLNRPIQSNLSRIPSAQQSIVSQNTRTIMYGTGSGVATGLAISAGQSIQNKLEKLEAK